MVVLTATIGAALLLVAGLVFAVHLALTSTAKPTPAAPNGAHVTQPSGIPQSQALSREDRRDGIAAAPMPAARPSDAKPTPPATELAEPLTVPAATTAGPAMVPSGFPRTPQGAVGQLAAIEMTVLQAMSIPVAHTVYEQWALPGGVGAGEWSMTDNVQSFLGAAQMGAEKDLRTVVLATPAAAQVKGTDGPDWVLACVLLEVRAFIESDARIGYGHCERMQWHEEHEQSDQTGTAGGRWMIAPGDPPAPAPSTWPGSDKAIAAGWKNWVNADSGASPATGPTADPTTPGKG